MKFKGKEISKLRTYVKQQLKYVPNEVKVKLDKELLELLLFDKIIYDQKKGAVVKLPIWSGDFLSKIDLSEIDFEDVSWSLLSDPYLACQYFDPDALAKYKKRKLFSNIMYMNTNASIDFTKSFEAKNSADKLARIKYCNFSGTDLSHQNLNLFEIIEYCNLSNTGLKVFAAKFDKRIKIFHTNFSNLDFSTIRVAITDLVFDSYVFNKTCVFKNTGLLIVYDLKKFELGRASDALKKIELGRASGALKNIKHYFAGMIKEGKLDGCYIHELGKDGFKTIHSKGERMDIRSQKQQEYRDYYLRVESSLNDIIQKQIGAINPNN